MTVGLMTTIRNFKTSTQNNEDVPVDEESSDDVSMEDLGEDAPERTVPVLSKMAACMMVEMRSNSAVTGAVLSRMFDFSGRCVDVLLNDIRRSEKCVE